MAILELFSKRQKKLRGEVPDVYQYTDIPNPLRVQIIHIIRIHLVQIVMAVALLQMHINSYMKRFVVNTVSLDSKNTLRAMQKQFLITSYNAKIMSILLI